MIRFSLFLLLATLFLAACNTSIKTDEEMNPLLSEWKTPFEVPPFEDIKPEHYLPAFKKAMEVHKMEVEAIIQDEADPGFENTIVALDLSGKLLDKVSGAFYPINSANTNPEIQAVNREVSPMLTKHQDDIGLDPRLFERIKAVWESREEAGLSNAQSKLLERYYKNFIRSGADLPEDKKEELRSINEKLATLGVQFSENLLAETNDYKLVIENEDDLAGLPEGVIQAAAETANKTGHEG